jgi:uncharacterized protein YjiS (DUF1127 family)
MSRTSITAPAQIGRRLRHVLVLWQARAAERRCLAEMGHRELRDIGISEGEAFAEARKPFWIA